MQLVVVGGEETLFLSSYLRCQHIHQRQSSDVWVNAIITTLQRHDVAGVDRVHLRAVTVISSCASLSGTA